MHDRVGAAAEVLARLATACDDLALGAIMLPFASDLLAGTLNVDVEAACQTAIGRDRDNQTALELLMRFEHGVIACSLCIARNSVHDVGERLLVGLSLRGSIERATDLGRRDHLHRARDLLGARDRGDSLLNVAKVGHGA